MKTSPEATHHRTLIAERVESTLYILVDAINDGSELSKVQRLDDCHFLVKFPTFDFMVIVKRVR